MQKHKIRRHDLSFFFPDDAKTKKAARALEQAGTALR